MNIDTNLHRIRAEIATAENKYQREKGSVMLIAVSKTRPVSDIKTAISAGQTHFGENYCQEAIEKIEAINNPNVCWHFIGPIQSNKTRQIATHFDWVHTVDRVKIAKRLDEARPRHKAPINICIQINISGETSKSGIELNEVEDFIEEIKPFINLKLRGLMALPAPSNDFVTQRESFAKLRQCMERLKQTMPELNTLSMGTTQDMLAAIAEGSTMVRIGTAIFGPRNARK